MCKNIKSQQIKNKRKKINPKTYIFDSNYKDKVIKERKIATP
jgi:hypothetical protein